MGRKWAAEKEHRMGERGEGGGDMRRKKGLCSCHVACQDGNVHKLARFCYPKPIPTKIKSAC